MTDGPFVPYTMPERRHNEGAKKYMFEGEMLRLADISVLTGIPVNTLRARMASGKTIEQATANTDYRGHAYKAPKKSTAQRHLYHGELLTIREISERSGINLNTIYSRFYSGWKVDDLGEELAIGGKRKND